MIGEDDPEELDKKRSARARRPTRVAPPKQRTSERDVELDELLLEDGPPAAQGDEPPVDEALDEAPEGTLDEAPEDRLRSDVAEVRKRPADMPPRPSATHEVPPKRVRAIADDGLERRALRGRPRARHPSGAEARPERHTTTPPSMPPAERPTVRPARRVLARVSDMPPTVRPQTPTPAARSSSRPPHRGPSEPAPSPRDRAAPSDTERPSVRPFEGPGSVLVTGICGRLGRLVARDLHRVDSVIGVDRRPFDDRPKDIVFHELDLRRKKTRDIFRSGRVRAVVHLGVLHDPRTSTRDRHTWNVVGFQKLLEYMTQYQVRKLVVLSSANVYGPQPDNPQFLTEEAPLLGSQEFGGIRDLVELDMLAQSHFWRHPDAETVILRPCHIVGSVRNAPSNYLRLSRPITILGFDPMIQIIHERDVVQAIMMALRPGVRGIFNLRGQGELPLSRILERLGKRPRPLPGPVARLAVDRLWKLRLASFPSPELDHVRYLCMVDDTRAREVLGYKPRYSLDETLEAVLAPL
jgi:UDP-glucose 4-epimerase